MNVLVACEESQRVCLAFRAKGHNAFSCDILPCSGGHPEYHIQGDVLPFINGFCKFTTCDGFIHFIDCKWDLIIAHPPCTYLSNAGARHLYKGGSLNVARFNFGCLAAQFFMSCLNADCDKICVENPIPSRIYGLPRYSQIIQPFEYGHPYTKKTCLWLKGLPLLKPSNIVAPIATYCPSGSYSKTHNECFRGLFTTDRKKNRSKTFPGVALAMAEQWGEYIKITA